jgi:hypothetical protein
MYLIVSLIAMAVLVTPVRAGLVTNGDFETGLTGWALTGNTAFMNAQCDSGTHSGACYASMGPVGSLGYIYQDLTTTVGAQYTISMWLSSDGGTTNEFTVDWGGSRIVDQVNVPNQPYTRVAFQAVATGSTTRLQIGFRDDPGYLHLDDVDVPTPEPASGALLLGALGMMGFALRRRRA